MGVPLTKSGLGCCGAALEYTAAIVLLFLFSLIPRCFSTHKQHLDESRYLHPIELDSISYYKWKLDSITTVELTDSTVSKDSINMQLIREKWKEDERIREQREKMLEHSLHNIKRLHIPLMPDTSALRVILEREPTTESESTTEENE